MRLLVATLMATLALPIFAQGVIIDGQGDVTLSWTRPTEYIDGSPLPLAEIANYTVYWGEDPADLADSFVVDNGAVTSSMLQIALDGPATIFFAMTATSVNGEESQLSNMASKVFDVVIVDQREPGPPESVTVEAVFSCTTNTPGVTCTITVGDP